MTNKEVILKVLNSFINEIGKMKFLIISFFGFILAIFWMLEPFFYAKVIELIEGGFKSGVYEMNSFFLVFGIWSIFIIISSLYFYFYRYYLVDRHVLDFHEIIYRKWSNKIIGMQYGEFLNKKQGSLFKKFDRGIENHFNLLFFFFLDFIKNISSLILIAIILFYIDYRMAFATFSMLPVMIFVGYYFNNKTNGLQVEVNKDWDKSYGYMGDAISNMQLVKTLVLEKVFSKLMKDVDNRAITKQKKVSKRWSIADIYTGFLVMMSRFLVLGYGIFLLSKGELNFATLFLFFSFIGYIYFPLSFIFGKLRNIQEQLTSIKNFYEEFGDLNSDMDIIKCKNIPSLKGDIEFKKVFFGYSDSKTILGGLDFKINSGEKIAFVGTTGAGKSTIVNLMFRFWDISNGDILLDGININTIKKDSLRKNIGIVTQDNSLFNMTIKENLLFASPQASRKDIEDALVNAEAKFVFDLKDGINTIIGERGLKLSGGEKQRLGIARLFLKNPKILILDEATSALDNKTEKLVQKALDKLMKGRTSIVIAHRLSTIQNADKIFMLENGKIVEEGNYDELMNKNAKFYELANPDNLIIN